MLFFFVRSLHLLDRDSFRTCVYVCHYIYFVNEDFLHTGCHQTKRTSNTDVGEEMSVPMSMTTFKFWFVYFVKTLFVHTFSNRFNDLRRGISSSLRFSDMQEKIQQRRNPAHNDVPTKLVTSVLWITSKHFPSTFFRDTKQVLRSSFRMKFSCLVFTPIFDTMLKHTPWSSLKPRPRCQHAIRKKKSEDTRINGTTN